MAKEVKQKVFLMPKNVMEKDLCLILLKHPRTSSDVRCAFDPPNKLYEVIHYTEDISSWFIGESVSDDGSLYFLSDVDPLFFILPYANQQLGKFCPIADLLMDENYPDSHILSKCCTDEELRNIFDFKESAGYKVFSYSKTKTLHWLQEKAKILSKHLTSKDIDLSDGSKSVSLKIEESRTEEECLTYSCFLLSEYLSEDLSSELFSSLGLEKTVPVKPEASTNKTSKKQNTTVKPEDDYSCKNSNSSALQNKQKKKMTSAQKQLSKVDKSGMKSISSFFQKK